MEALCAKHKEVVEELLLDHRDDVDLLEKQIDYLCQGAPHKAKTVQARVKEHGLKRQAKFRAVREDLMAPLVLPPMPEEAIVAAGVKEEAEDASPVPTKAPSASALAHPWSPSWK